MTLKLGTLIDHSTYLFHIRSSQHLEKKQKNRGVLLKYDTCRPVRVDVE